MSCHRTTVIALRAGAVFALTYAGVYAFLWAPWGEVTLGWDMLTQYWPDTAYQAHWIGVGDVPLWNPFERLGYPAYADPQAGQFYPVNWLTYPLGWLGGWMPYWAPLLKNWLHLVIASAGMFMLLRRRREVPAACWVGGLLCLLHADGRLDGVGAARPSAWLPWVWLALDRLFARPTVRRGLQAGAVGGLPVLAGNPALFYSLLATLFFAGYLALVHGRRAANRWCYAGRVTGGLTVATLVTLCLGAPALLPVQELYQYSVRTQRGLAFVLNTNLTAEGLWGFLLPNLAPRSYLHFGLITLFFAGLALWRSPRRVAWAAALVLFGAMLAIGGHGFLLRALAEQVAPFGLFRGPHRYAVLCAAGLALWAPVGVSALARMDRAGRRRAAVWLASLGLLVASVGSLALAGVAPAGGAAGRLLARHTVGFSVALACSCVLVAALAWWPRIRQGWWQAAAVVATVLALWLGGYDKITKTNLFPRPDLRRDALQASLSRELAGARVYDDSLLLYRPGSRLSLKDASGYEGDPLGSLRYDQVMRQVRQRPELLGHLGVAAYLRGGHHPALGRRLGVRRGVFRQTASAGVYRLPAAAPLAYVVPQVTWVETAEQARVRWLAGPAGQTAVVARADLNDAPEVAAALEQLAAVPASSAVAGSLRQRSPDEIEVRVDSPAGGVAVLLEAWYPGWEATLDGKPAPVFQVNYLFRGVVVPAGAHTIRMAFRPWRFQASATLFGLGVLVVLWVQLRPLRRLRWAA